MTEVLEDMSKGVCERMDLSVLTDLARSSAAK
jgi:hypothetical protein